MNTVITTARRQLLDALMDQLRLPTGAVAYALLDLALTDISSSADANNEKLEFLGDAALRLAAGEFLMEMYPDMSLGEMSAVRSQLVSDRTLATLAKRYNLGHYLVLSKSAAGDKAGEDSRLADTVEAILGALYLSTSDLSLIHPWLDPQLERITQALRSDPARQNYKAALQELTQSHYKSLPVYTSEEISKTHGDEERFRAEAWFNEALLGEGKGRSIKQAEQVAARMAFNKLRRTVDSKSENKRVAAGKIETQKIETKKVETKASARAS